MLIFQTSFLRNLSRLHTESTSKPPNPFEILIKSYVQKKNRHFCKDTKMATPFDFCRGMTRPENWYRF